MTRLAILDLRKNLYPLKNEDQTIQLIYNGEIYNFSELTTELRAKGHTFASKVDGEVLVHGYEEWGLDCLRKLNGMWAFALWDSRQERLIIGRDHAGIKPLYYHVDDDLFAFASEIQPLLYLPFVEKKPNEPIVFDYLVDGRLDHTEETFFHSILRVMPAHYIAISRDSHFEKVQYWKMPSVSEETSEESMKMDAERLKMLFVDSVRLRLISDVTVGSCLSGGLDSSAIVSVISRLKDGDKKSIGQRLQAVSACYPGEDIDESQFINVVAENTPIDVNLVCPTSSELWRDLQKLVQTQEEPFGGTSVYAQWRVMQAAKARGITVMLDGQGNDELLAGYPEYVVLYIADLIKNRKVLTATREMLRFADTIIPLIPLIITGVSRTARLLRYLNPEFVARNSSTKNFRFGSRTTLGQMLWDDTTRRVLPSLLRYEDKNSMHFSIEARLPFLDPRLIELAASLPLGVKIGDGWTKRVFREAMKGILPAPIAHRRRKIGFQTPQQKWLFHELHDKLEDLLSSEMRAAKFVNQKELLNLLHMGRRKTLSRWYSDLFWRCIDLELWMREFIPPSSG
jgi:asparagine synthase (glutamine-hydrolysing)